MVLKERFEGAETEHFVENLLDDAILLQQAERGLFFFDQLGDGGADFSAHALIGHGGKRFQIDPVEKFAMDSELQFLVLGSVSSGGKKATDPTTVIPTLFGPRCVFQNSRHSCPILYPKSLRRILGPFSSMTVASVEANLTTWLPTFELRCSMWHSANALSQALLISISAADVRIRVRFWLLSLWGNGCATVK